MAEVENLKRHPFQNTPLQIRTLSPRERDWPYSTQEVHVRVQERTQIYLALHFSDKRDSELMEKEYLLGQIMRPRAKGEGKAALPLSYQSALTALFPFLG